MHVILSSGQGPLHFVSSAHALSEKVGKLDFVCGYVPKHDDSFLLRLLASLKGKKITAAIKKHRIENPTFAVCSCVFAEMVQQIVDVLRKFLPNLFSSGFWETFPWVVFGWQSKKYLIGGDVFHVRSGAGHGGAIKRARELGMKVIVDHSIAHPKFMDENMRSEFERNGVPFHMGMSSPFWRMIDEDCRNADIVQVNSQFVKRTFVDAGYSPEKVRVVHLGVRRDFFGLRTHKANPRGLKLLFTGGFGFRKGGEYILESMRMLKARGLDFSLDIVGDYSTAIDMIKRFEKYQLPIVYHGQKPQDELKSFLADADVYVFPSLAEGCAQSGMEAMAAGLCVIGTYESGFPIVDGETGFVVPGKDAKAIADKIEWLFNHPADIDRIGQNAAKLIAEHYTWEHYAENTVRIYEELLNA